MPVKKRSAKAKPYRVTPAAVAAFNAGDREALHLALGLPPYVVSPLRVDDGPCPWPPGCAGHMGWPIALALRDELIAAGARKPEGAA